MNESTDYTLKQGDHVYPRDGRGVERVERIFIDECGTVRIVLYRYGESRKITIDHDDYIEAVRAGRVAIH